MKVTNMCSNSSGREVPNQFIITDVNKTYFQSYDSIIVMVNCKGKVFLDERYWDYSVTTGKYRNQFLNENIAITRQKIKSGEYTLRNLN